MPKKVSVVKSVTYDNVITASTRSLMVNNNNETIPTVPAALIGVLTVRTDNAAGSLTMNPGHGLVTGQIVDMFWVGGSRYGVVLGTVATNVVPISGGAGDNNPVAATAITVSPRLAEAQAITGNNVLAIIISSPVFGYVHITQADGLTVIADFKLVTDDSGLVFNYTWDTNSGLANPLAGGAIGKVLFSHGDSAGSHPMTCQLLSN